MKTNRLLKLICHTFIPLKILSYVENKYQIPNDTSCNITHQLFHYCEK
ncbi:unnamed protein product [Paramecium octaurelia]|uniref:Uncharacterized protein n=1 Tax=Paramecium octaurelia TaxID=43137 RepID=A0A8S1S8E6_PAROT|nr:unnamed protein product [Paramecium octaurelia]